MANITVRENCVRALKNHLETVVAGEPVADPYEFEWSYVTRQEIGQLARGKRNALGIYDGEERKTQRTYPVTDCQLRVAVEFHLYADTDKVSTEELNKYLGEISRRIRENRTLDGHAYDVNEVGSDLDIDSPYDRQVSGVVFLDIFYRHHEDDPRTSITGIP
jgi:hypothetical protein